MTAVYCLELKWRRVDQDMEVVNHTFMSPDMSQEEVFALNALLWGTFHDLDMFAALQKGIPVGDFPED